VTTAASTAAPVAAHVATPPAAPTKLPGHAVASRLQLAWTNATTGVFHLGNPMVGLPLFWDQYDNAQRIAETGYGIRLETYEFEDGELLGTVDRVLTDHSLRARMAAIASRVQAAPGTVRAADLIERLG